MRLSDLIRSADVPVTVTGPADPTIAGLTADSRAAGAGFLFAALPGTKHDGRAFIPAALASGAVAILAPEGTELPDGPDAVPLITAANPRRAFARFAGAFFGRQPETAVAVTGTNGKTSTAHFVEQLWTATGARAASLGTLGIGGRIVSRPGSLTTPDPVALHETLAELADAGIDHVALEASSHGLHQHRLDGIRLKAGAFTNLSRDHLDYHGTMEAYLEAKARLFRDLLPAGAPALLNADIPEFRSLCRISRDAGLRTVSYGRDGRDIRLVGRTALPDGQTLALEIKGHRARIDLPLIGDFMAMNALAALGLVLETGTPLEPALRALGALNGADGRLELVGRLASGAAAYVDYAHTPDALDRALAALRPHAHGRLMVVFGCGGDRDPGKRPEMAAVCARRADLAILTDDNPRSEDPAEIRRQARAGADAAANLIEIGDRAEAIRHAVDRLASGDVLVVAGKGHEPGQTVSDGAGGTVTLPFDDREVTAAAIAGRGKAGAGSVDPGRTGGITRLCGTEVA